MKGVLKMKRRKFINSVAVTSACALAGIVIPDFVNILKIRHHKIRRRNHEQK